MKKTLYLLISALTLFLAHPSLAQNSPRMEPSDMPDMMSDDMGTDVMLRDGKIMIESKTGNKVLDYNAPSNTYSPYSHLKKWKVTKSPDSVNEALKVFDKKGEGPTEEKYWIINDETGARIVVEYNTYDPYSQMQFSPNEDFVYYKSTSDLGGSLIYGINLQTQNQFTVGNSNDFGIVSCPNKKSYISLMNENGQEKVFSVYNLDGTKVNDYNLDDNANFGNLENYICY